MALQTTSTVDLELLYEQALSRGLEIIPFREPDLNDEITALAFVPNGANKRFLSHLPLAGRKAGNIDKHAMGASL